MRELKDANFGKKSWEFYIHDFSFSQQFLSIGNRGWFYWSFMNSGKSRCFQHRLFFVLDRLFIQFYVSWVRSVGVGGLIKDVWWLKASFTNKMGCWPLFVLHVKVFLNPSTNSIFQNVASCQYCVNIKLVKSTRLNQQIMVNMHHNAPYHVWVS